MNKISTLFVILIISGAGIISYFSFPKENKKISEQAPPINNKLLPTKKPAPTDTFKVMEILGYSEKFEKRYEAITLRSTVEQLARDNPRKLFINGQSNQKKIALTFDDGPHPKNTGRILKILDDYNIEAAFFFIGQNVAYYPNIVKEVHQNNHLVLNHSFSHAKFIEIDSTAVAREIQKTNEAIYQAAGIKPQLIRQPYGAINQEVLNIITKQNMAVVHWSLDAYDWLESPEFVKNLIAETIRNDEIILLHNRPATIENLPAIIELIQSKGFSIVRLDELLSVDAYQ